MRVRTGARRAGPEAGRRRLPLVVFFVAAGLAVASAIVGATAVTRHEAARARYEEHSGRLRDGDGYDPRQSDALYDVVLRQAAWARRAGRALAVALVLASLAWALRPRPAEPSPAEPSPAEPSPAEPSPAEPSPAEPSPAEPSPAEPGPAEATAPSGSEAPTRGWLAACLDALGLAAAIVAGASLPEALGAPHAALAHLLQSLSFGAAGGIAWGGLSTGRTPGALASGVRFATSTKGRPGPLRALGALLGLLPFSVWTPVAGALVALGALRGRARSSAALTPHLAWCGIRAVRAGRTDRSASRRETR